MLFEKFQDGHHANHLGYWNRTILAILILYISLMPPIILDQSHQRFGRRCRLKNFKMGLMAAILDIGTILAILNLYNAPMPPIKFRLNLTYGLGGDVV